MLAIGPWLVGILGVAMASLAFRVLLAVGVGFVTYTGISIALETWKTNLVSSINSLPAEALGFVGFLWLDKGLTLIFSAMVAALSITAVSGAVKKMVFK